jgi:hypothetical protein
MIGIAEADSRRKGAEYRGSPAPFAFFLVLFLVFLVLAVLYFPYPAIEPQKYILPVLFGIIAFVSLGFLRAHYAAGNLGYAHWTGSTWNIQIVNSTGGMGTSETSLALDSNDKPHISHYDYLNYDLWYAHWTGSEWNTQVVDSAGTVGMWPSIAVDSNDRAHISYYDETNHVLKYATWTGSTWNIQPVTTGRVSSIAVDSSDRPHISYHDYTNDDLKYATWTGAAWSIETVYSEGDVGWYTSIALDSADRPHISYCDEFIYPIPYGELKYATLVDQYEVTFGQTGVGADFSGTVVTIDSVDYTVADLPVTFTWNKDSSHTFSYASPLEGSDNKYIWTETLGLSTLQSDTLMITESGSITANYETQYQLIEELTQELIEEIETWNLPIGTEKSLVGKLEASLKLIAKGNEVGAIHKLMDFINQVEGLREKKLSNDQADQLISGAQRIIDLIQQ